MLDLRKTKEIKMVDEGAPGLFCIVPISSDNSHPGYLMRADTKQMAEEWVAGLNKVREQELEKVCFSQSVSFFFVTHSVIFVWQSPLEHEGRHNEETVCCCCKRRRSAEHAPLMSG